MYMSALILNWSTTARLLSEANNGLFSDAYDGRESLAAFQNSLHMQSTIASFALGANVNTFLGKMLPTSNPFHQFIIGDAIVWWRVCAIWRSKAVYFTAIFILTSTLGMYPLLKCRREGDSKPRDS